MRRKVYTKDQILKAAYDVVAKEGFDLSGIQKHGRFKKYVAGFYL